MAFAKIKELLHETIGLHSKSVGESSIDRAINHRIRIANVNNTNSYFRLLKDEPDELAELIEEVVVPETWFFRNSTPFDVLREYVLKIQADGVKCSAQGKDKKQHASLKILSAPCSSGEEPYSIAMTLCDAGLTKDDFQVDAIDVSERALKKAKSAIYGKHSFREEGFDFQKKYFRHSHSEYHLDQLIQDQVTFQRCNLLKDQISPLPAYYDVIFCRNLLIYFDRPTQKKIIEKLKIMLKRGGLLFVGHAESGQVDKTDFIKVRTARAFAFRKRAMKKHATLDEVVATKSTASLRDIYAQLVEVTKKDIALSKKYSSLKKVETTSSGKQGFHEVDKLINSGHLVDASKLCEEILSSDPENPDGYFYLGLICNLEGSVGSAESLLRKAIYLSPNHHKALALSAFLAEGRGDAGAAKSLRRRELKARQRNK